MGGESDVRIASGRSARPGSCSSCSAPAPLSGLRAAGALAVGADLTLPQLRGFAALHGTVRQRSPSTANAMLTVVRTS